MFILAGLAGAAGVLLLPAPGAVVSPVFIPCSCQGSSQAAEGMVRPRWETGAGERAHAPACLGTKESLGTIPWDAPRPVLGMVGPSCSHPAGSDLGVSRICWWQNTKVQCLLLTREISWIYSSESTKVTPWSSRVLQVMDQ